MMTLPTQRRFPTKSRDNWDDSVPTQSHLGHDASLRWRPVGKDRIPQRDGHARAAQAECMDFRRRKTVWAAIVVSHVRGEAPRDTVTGLGFACSRAEAR